MKILTEVKKEMRQTELHPRHLVKIEITIHPLLRHTWKPINMRSIIDQTKKKKEIFTTKLSPSSFRRVSLKFDTINAHTLKMFATMSTRWSVLESFVRMDLMRAEWKAIQSRDLAFFSQLKKNSVIENTFKLPKALEAVRCKHCLNKWRLKVRYMTVFQRYPMPK